MLAGMMLMGMMMLLGIAEGVAPPPAPPTVVGQFYDPEFKMSLGYGFEGGIAGDMWYDEDYGAWKAFFNLDYFAGLQQNLTFLQAPQGFYYDSNDVCRLFGSGGNSSGFNSFFSWLPAGTYNGLHNLTGRLVDEWVLDFHNGELILDVDHNNNSIPVRFIVPSTTITTTSIVNFTFLWSDQLVPGAISNPDQIFEVAPSCLGQGEVCSPDPAAPNGVELLDVYVFHDANNFSLINVNVADALGDTFFVCGAVMSDQFTYFQWVSWWEISVNISYGQYQFCNFGSCMGGNKHLVGREGAEGIGEHAGQCTSGPGSANSILGTWYSLPEEGVCDEGAEVGTNGCTWQVVGRMKTINASCLLANGFIDACQSSFHIQNLTAANQLYLAAFQSDDPAVGGCPPLPGPEFTSRAALGAFNLAKSSGDVSPMESSPSQALSHAVLQFASTLWDMGQSRE